MGGRQDVFVVDERTAAVVLAPVRDHRHPRILVLVRRSATDDSFMFPQSPTS